MTFGFPAYHEENVRLEVDRHAASDAIRETFEELGWQFREREEGCFTATARFNRWENSSRFSASVDEFSEMRVRSECRWPTQCFDWGRNAVYVRAFVSKVTGKATRKNKLDQAFPERQVGKLDAEGRTPVERMIADDS